MNSTKFCAQLTKRLLLTASNRHKTAKVIVRNFTASRVDATEWSSNVYSNPMRELQPLLQVPLTNLAEELFNPSEREIGAGHEMLRRTDRNISLYKGEIRPESLPELNLPEVCFAGRSNVGKSSLIGSLLNNNQIVTKKFKVSSTPGFTKCLRLVQVKRMFSLVDMPGYGENMPPDFVDMVEGYLQTREQLSAVFLLVDGNDGFHSVDQTAIEMLEEYGKPYAVVMTKIDKSTPHTTLTNILSFVELSKKMPSCFPQPFLVSSLHGYGIAYLQTYLLYTMGIFAIKGL